MKRRTLLASLTATSVALAGCVQESCSVELIESGSIVTDVSSQGEGDLLVLLSEGAHESHEIAEIRLFDGVREQVASSPIDGTRTDVPMDFESEISDPEPGRGVIHVTDSDGGVLESVRCSVGCP